VSGLDVRIVRERLARRGGVGHVEDGDPAQRAVVLERPVQHVHPIGVELRQPREVLLHQRRSLCRRHVLVRPDVEEDHLVGHHLLRGRRGRDDGEQERAEQGGLAQVCSHADHFA
jgi:hypothetical protein